ncbi:hypothetical protein [Paracoccus sp. (in: a-proteobacteria)]|uniref:hypothetical protein n=1 Tax=Paracoccus sp. TaxID=267 RepID=UPI0040591123
MVLERRGSDHAGQAGLFARAYARLRDWIDNHGGRAWPFPRPTGPGMPLAGSPAALRRHIARRIRTSRLLHLLDLEDRRRQAIDVLTAEFDLDAHPDAGHGDTILLLTPSCRGELAEDPAWYRDRLTDLCGDQADIGVINLGEDDPTRRFSSLSDMIRDIDTQASLGRGPGSMTAQDV